MLIGSQLIKARLQQVAGTIASIKKGLIYFAKDRNVPLVDNGTIVDEIVTRDRLGTIIVEDSHQLLQAADPATVTVPVLDINWKDGNVFTKDLDLDAVFTFSNIKDATTPVLRVRNTHATDAINVTLPAAKWPDGVVVSAIQPQTEVLFGILNINGDLYINALTGWA